MWTETTGRYEQNSTGTSLMYDNNGTMTGVSFSGSTTSEYVINTTVGTQIYIDLPEEIKGKKKVIHPKLYFKFVKSKLNKLEQSRLNERLIKLQTLVQDAKQLGQKALYEEFARKIAIIVREQEINVCGVEYFVDKNVVTKYMNRVKDVEIHFDKLENYSRPVPAMVKERIKKMKKLKLFDDYWILYLNYPEKEDIYGFSKKEEKLKTNKEKIKEKDPIIFGVQDYMPDKLYFIIDWIDEYCDLTLNAFVDRIKETDKEYDIDTLDYVDDDLIQKLVKETRDKYKRLKKTNPDNYKKLMAEEDK